MNTEELLKVLDMSEEEQVEFFYIKGYRQLVDTFPAGGLKIKYNEKKEIISVKHSQSELRFDRRALADLAFRLRDEVKSKVEFHHCIAKVCKHLDPYIINYAGYGLCTCKPIHWIIAALIALKNDLQTTNNTRS